MATSTAGSDCCSDSASITSETASASATSISVTSCSDCGPAGIYATLIDGAVHASAVYSVGYMARYLSATVESVEGPNEPDLQLGRGWRRIVGRFAPALHAALAASPQHALALLGPAFATIGARIDAAPLAHDWRVENFHSYPGGQQPSRGLAGALARSRALHLGAPMVSSETSYHTATRATYEQPGVSEHAAAVYLPRLLLQYFAAGVSRTFLYELLDEHVNTARDNPENSFGLIGAHMVAKPAYWAIKNLLAIVNTSPGSGRGRPVAISSPPGSVETLLLRRADGSRMLFLWRPVSVYDTNAHRSVGVSPILVRLHFAGRRVTGRVYDPTRSAVGHPVVGRGAQGLAVSLGGDVVAVGFR